ncbi:PIG-L deacetylase family protein [Streptomyces sp. NPDC101132]|uniref:PIG-L deacetylase family protein n=1 Tax=Streptomyces sp. NPDC101132 TaxID=3366110 RepID=UPI0037F9FE80
MAPPSLLGVFAHPDDEALAAGGLLARHAAAGARTAVVTATWAAGTHRAAELADALRILGAGAPRLLGFADARVPESSPGPRFVDVPVEVASAPLADLLAGVGKRLHTVPDGYATTAVDVRPWTDRKWAAVLAHRSEARRARSLPGLLSGLPDAARRRLLGTEWFTRHAEHGGPRADGDAG